jgi:hypothetical protein
MIIDRKKYKYVDEKCEKNAIKTRKGRVEGNAERRLAI